MFACRWCSRCVGVVFGVGVGVGVVVVVVFALATCSACLWVGVALVCILLSPFFFFCAVVLVGR